MSDVRRIPGNARMSSAVIHSGVGYFKGVTARNRTADVAAQTQDVLAQIDALLDSAGTSKDNVLQVTVWLKDIDSFDAMNAVYDEWVVPGAQPVRACVEAKLASPDLLVEIRVTAAV